VRGEEVGREGGGAFAACVCAAPTLVQEQGQLCVFALLNEEELYQDITHTTSLLMPVCLSIPPPPQTTKHPHHPLLQGVWW